MSRYSIAVVMSTLMILQPVITSAGEPFRFSSFFRQKRPTETAVVQLARTLDDLEKRLNKHGTVVAKAPDIWGEARLTKHRQEFEREMAKEVENFDFRINAAIARTDQAFLASALSLSLLGEGITDATKAPNLNVSQSASMLPALESQAATDPANAPVKTVSNSVVTQTTPGGLIGSEFGIKSKEINIEPEIFLDQKARYLNHLHELRRINEGDDTSDSPGYSMNLVRVPVSIMPGAATRKNHGAEVTITATPHITEELLPSTFRELVINDLLDLLGPVVRKFAQELPEIAEPIDSRKITDYRDKKFIDLLKGEGEAAESSFVFRRYYGINGIHRNPLPGQPDGDIGQAIPLNDIGTTAPAFVENSRTLLSDPAAMRGVDVLKLMRNPENLKPAAIKAIHAIIPSRLLQTNVGSVTRRARQPISSSQIPITFGLHELMTLGFDFRSRAEPDGTIHLSDVRAYLREELQSAYDLISRPDHAADHLLRDPAIVLDDGYSSSSLLRHIRSVDYDNAHELGVKRANISNQFSQLYTVTIDNTDYEMHLPSVTSSLAWAVIVESVLLNDRLNEDIKHVSRDPECGCSCPGELIFCGARPNPHAREVFADYVKCRWPIHVFALDPQTQDQNVADSFSMRREMQLAMALAFAGGDISAQKMTRYVRRLELDMETIALNRTAAAFGHGRDVFGWRFYPRVQTPPFESTSTTVFRDLIGGGPNKDALRRSWEIEPGMRDCTAVVLMPSFITHVTFDVRGNYFPLGRHKFREPSDTRTSIEENMEMSHKIRLMQNATCSIAAEANCYRDGEVERLMRRADQIAKKLPLQTVHARVPNENVLGGFEMFSSGISDLAPELLDFYGMPGIDPKKKSTLFLVGNNFSVHETRVLAGNREVKYELISRQVMKVTIPAGVQVVKKAVCDRVIECGQPEQVVDIHIATPYGVSQHLEVPVRQADEAKCVPTGYGWKRENLAATYRIKLDNKKTPATTDDELTLTGAKTLMSPPYTLNVAVPPGNFAHRSTATMTLVISVPKLGLSTVVQPPATQVFAAAFDPASSSYRISAEEFVKMQNSIRSSFVGLYNALNAGSIATGTGDFEIQIDGAITPDGAANAIPLDNVLTVNAKLLIVK